MNAPRVSATTAQLTADQEAELRRFKAYFPFRIVFGVINKDTGEFHGYADTTRRRMNNNLRKGHFVFQIGGK